MNAWQQLGANLILLIVSSVLVADVSINEDAMLLVLTGLCTVIL
jgi:hypothetical protein